MLEERAEFRSMMPTSGGHCWPRYFREKEGIAEAYAYFTFPKAKYPDLSMFLEAIPDMSRVINMVNDILSFYKEEMAGVQKNYIRQRAGYEDREVTAVLKSVAKECIEACKRIENVLEGREPYKKAWLSHLHGYLHMHRATARYKLHEIGLGEKSCVISSLTKESFGPLE
ncbi:Trichodiene synthase [Cytospora mali]|uniref:Trichodiene synthase n=1 Tax=Cytospora mali TaxID=578113 RepID=A0A194V557_CYTMA|nr:Trichodiene synthase [Valsa mali var. pyri (nom. inval.)]